MVHTDEIRDLIKKHDYEVKMNITSDGDIVVSFPSRIESPKCEGFSNTYQIEEDGVMFKLEESDEFIPSPNYTLRLIVLCDVGRLCSLIGYDASLINLSIDDKEVAKDDFKEAMLDMIPSGLSKDELELERILKELIEEGSHNGFTEELEEMAEEYEVHYGFTILRNILIGAA